ncbi:MAG TPA: L-seryl-tRNA(Sec) selenium transferase [Ktedonobacterales bacterium]
MTREANGRHTHQSVDATPAPARAAMRSLPSVDDLRIAYEAHLATSGVAMPSHATLVRSIRASLQEARESIRLGGSAPDLAALVMQTQRMLARQSGSVLRPVINATGVVINTNLGRSPLSQRAIEAVVSVARGYSNLEFDLDKGGRGSRQTHTRDLVRELTGAEDALVVNNNAAATLVSLAALAAGREVIIARGELVEIGGGFRVPDVMAQSGARLVEVGTTNRVRLSDYANAITPDTALLLVVHPSNFRVIGFTEAPALADLAALAHEHGLPLMHDLGSGALVATERWGLGHEPSVTESVRAGADITCFSGDKLLGGPQAGIMIGHHETIGRIEHHPLMRAIRIDKLTLAALEATLRAYRDETFEAETPIWRAIAQPLDMLRARAERLASRLNEAGLSAEVIEGESTVGGGSLPGETLPTFLCALPRRSQQHSVDPARLADRLRAAPQPVIARVLRDQLLLDLRTIAPTEEDRLVEALQRARRESEQAR